MTKHATTSRWLRPRPANAKICYPRHSITYLVLVASTKRKRACVKSKRKSWPHSRSARSKSVSARKKNATRTRSRCLSSDRSTWRSPKMRSCLWNRDRSRKEGVPVGENGATNMCPILVAAMLDHVTRIVNGKRRLRKTLRVENAKRSHELSEMMTATVMGHHERRGDARRRIRHRKKQMSRKV